VISLQTPEALIIYTIESNKKEERKLLDSQVGLWYLRQNRFSNSASIKRRVKYFVVPCHTRTRTELKI
jgi:hypothetical protein